MRASQTNYNRSKQTKTMSKTKTMSPKQFKHNFKYLHWITYSNNYIYIYT